jgi:hypothetical protein
MGKRKVIYIYIYIETIACPLYFTLYYAQVTPSEQRIPEIINHPWLQLLTPGVFLGNSALL